MRHAEALRFWPTAPSLSAPPCPALERDYRGSHAATTATTTHTTTTTTISGIFVCIIFGSTGRIAERSRIAHQALGVHRMPRSVAGDDPRVLLGCVMLLVRCFA